MKFQTSLLITIAASGFSFTASARADDCFVYSKDHTVVTGDCSGEEPEPGGIASGGAGGVPFGTVPDWQNDIRRQVAALAIHDMNGDGLQDLVVGCFKSSS